MTLYIVEKCSDHILRIKFLVENWIKFMVGGSNSNVLFKLLIIISLITKSTNKNRHT